jgi:HSP20 family protein
MTPFGGGFGSLFGLRREIDRLFEDAYGGTTSRATWTPTANVREAKDAVLLEMELPGVTPDQVEISIDNDMLTVSGEKGEERREGEDDARFYLVERSYGSFSRTFSLPPGVDADQVEASFENGLLSIRIPRAALPQPRRVEISTKGTGEIASGRDTSRAAPRSQERSRSESREGVMAAQGAERE